MMCIGSMWKWCVLGSSDGAPYLPLVNSKSVCAVVFSGMLRQMCFNVQTYVLCSKCARVPL
jgi:hypothetical protein